MRRLSLTLRWPMNSASRCGRSDSSTTLSSARTSGVVISVRDMTHATRVLGTSRRFGTGLNIPRTHTEDGAGPRAHRWAGLLVALTIGTTADRMPGRIFLMQERNATAPLTESAGSMTMLAVEPSDYIGLFGRK